MRTAVISYGSLANQLTSPANGNTLKVNRPNVGRQNHNFNLSANSPFVPAQGLSFPVELGRESSSNTENRRITMTIQDGAPQQQVFFAESNFTNLNDSIKNLRLREGTVAEHISYVNLNERTGRYKNVETANKVATWARDNGFDAVIYTELPSNISTQTALEQKILADPVLKRNTQEYIRNLPTAPSQLQQRILDAVQMTQAEYIASLTADFPERDLLPQCNKPRSQWQNGGIWGPDAAHYPKVEAPRGVNSEQWMRDRIVAVAKRYEQEQLKYKTNDGTGLGKRGHFPVRGHGLDCSNFTSWVYNYGLGIQFSTGVDEQMNPRNYVNTMGPLIKNREPQPGDLLYFKPPAGSNVAHVVIYVGKNSQGKDIVIDSTSGRRHVAVRESSYWANTNNPRYVGFRSPIAQANRA